MVLFHHCVHLLPSRYVVLLFGRTEIQAYLCWKKIFVQQLECMENVYCFGTDYADCFLLYTTLLHTIEEQDSQCRTRI